jgi:hypothetical protein
MQELAIIRALRLLKPSTFCVEKQKQKQPKNKKLAAK